MVAAVCACAALAPAATASEPANVNWPSYLPAMPGSSATQRHSVPYCRKPIVKCIDTGVTRLRGAQRRVGCDHRGVFATTYLELTRQLRDTLRARPRFFNDARYLYTEDALFGDIYFNTVRDYERGEPVAPAWQIAFDTAKSGDVNVDHDTMNDPRRDRFDPLMATTDPPWTSGDDAAGMELVKEWREQVWRSAERLLAAKTTPERAQVASQIHQYAAGWARMIANPVQMPGYRAQRDAYCEQAMQAQS